MLAPGRQAPRHDVGYFIWEEQQAIEAIALAIELGLDVNTATDRGETALHGATRHAAHDVIRFLVEQGADVEARTWADQTPLRIAEGYLYSGTYVSYPETAELLLSLGADPDAGTQLNFGLTCTATRTPPRKAVAAEMTLRAVAAGSLVAALALAGMPPPAAAQPAAQASLTPELEAHGLALRRYCVGCHNERLRTAGLQLDQVDVAQVARDPDVWEKVVRKLRTGLMPPDGRPRPDAATYASLVGAPGDGAGPRGGSGAESGLAGAGSTVLNRAEIHPTQCATCWSWKSTDARCCRPTIRVTASTTSATC